MVGLAAAAAAFLTSATAHMATVAPALIAPTAALIATVALIEYDRSTPKVYAMKAQSEIAVECVKRNVAALNKRLVAVATPLYGTEKFGVTVKRGVVGDPVMGILIQDTDTGSQAEFQPISGIEPPSEIDRKILEGC